MPVSGKWDMLEKSRPFIWAFIPHMYKGDSLQTQEYDNFGTKHELAVAFHEIGCPWVWQPVTLQNMEDVVEQVVESMRARDTMVFNFCDGDEINGYPGISVVRMLERRRVPFTGADSWFYEASTSKVALKSLFDREGVPTPAWSVIPDTGPVSGVCGMLGAPLIVKPAVSAGSYGLSVRSVVADDREIERMRDELKGGDFEGYFTQDPVFAEKFINGPEFTALVMGYWDEPGGIQVLPPVQRLFHGSFPDHERFLSYDRYWALYKEETPPPPGERFYTYGPAPRDLQGALADLCRKAYLSVKGTGYGRVDIRMDKDTGDLFVLEVNANCGLSGDEHISTIGNILKLAGLSFNNLIGEIVNSARRKRASFDEGSPMQ